MPEDTLNGLIKETEYLKKLVGRLAAALDRCQCEGWMARSELSAMKLLDEAKEAQRDA